MDRELFKALHKRCKELRAGGVEFGALMRLRLYWFIDGWGMMEDIQKEEK